MYSVKDEDYSYVVKVCQENPDEPIAVSQTQLKPAEGKKKQTWILGTFDGAQLQGGSM